LKFYQYSFSFTFVCYINPILCFFILQGGKVPIRWTAPEAVIYRRFTIATDIWSFGIVSWELFSYGTRPYWEWTNQAVISMLEKGYRLPCPTGCPPAVHRMMLNCWATDAEKRPDFCAIQTLLQNLMDSENQDLIDTTEEQQKNANSSASEGFKRPSVNGSLTRNVNTLSTNNTATKASTAIVNTTMTNTYVGDSKPALAELDLRSNSVNYHNVSHPNQQQQQQQQPKLVTQRQPQSVSTDWEKLGPRPMENLRYQSSIGMSSENHVTHNLISGPPRAETASPYCNVNKYCDNTIPTTSEQSISSNDQTHFLNRGWLRAFPDPPILQNVNFHLPELFSLRRIRY
uniref:Protein kinase domain-containing protein n=1 Tax=Echinostoma caproni TaxID=27848 RepID=A0A183AIS5_9TREM